MSTRSRIPRRKRIFFGCEGASGRSLVTWLGRLCDESGLHLHLDQYDAGGGDGESVIRRSVNERKKRVRNDGGYYRSIVLLDSDRLETDRQAGRDPLVVAKDVTPVWLRPNYTKGVSAVELNERFGVDDPRRLARHDNQVQLLLELIFLAPA